MQNLIQVNLTDPQVAELDAAIATLRAIFAQMLALQPQQRRELTKMGEKSEVFCRQTLAVLAANPQIVPGTVNVGMAMGDLAALDLLRPRLLQLKQQVERLDDTVLALGSDVIACSLEGYALLKVAGKNEALKAARRDLSGRFNRSAPSPSEKPADPVSA
ncbi:hypothetical protein [Lysobacter niastensis]|uniref:Uncharacterized protein n=1 Tax=Lysobacter niastensis TaxID=380629 RepID=A0ABS0B8L4_9GAMM|nr:hypothetical protein [Lysobacter niastensis]MBF6025351.1 hypothetical protein [Lysobacter niastensis]